MNAPTSDGTKKYVFMIVQIRNVRKLYYVYQLIIPQKKIVRMLLLLMIQKKYVFMMKLHKSAKK